MAVLRKKARIVGRRAVDRHRHRGVGRGQVEAVVQGLHVVERRDRHPRSADFAVDVGPQVGVVAVQRHRVERGGQPGRGLALRQQLEAPVGAERVALAGEHPGRVLVVPLEREHAGGEREAARQVLRAQEPQQLAVVGVAGQGHPGDRGCRRASRATAACGSPGRAPSRPARPRCTLLRRGPGVQQRPALLAQLALGRSLGSASRASAALAPSASAPTGTVQQRAHLGRAAAGGGRPPPAPRVSAW